MLPEIFFISSHDENHGKIFLLTHNRFFMGRNFFLVDFKTVEKITNCRSPTHPGENEYEGD